MAADDDMARFEDWDQVSNGKIDISFWWYRVANANLTIGWHRPPNRLKSSVISDVFGRFPNTIRW